MTVPNHPWRIFPPGIVALLALLALLAWRLWSEESARLKETRQRGSKSPTHTHTITFTCNRTCTDLDQIPKVFPWNK